MNQNKVHEIQEHFRRGDLDAALVMANQALEETPDDPLLIFLVGLCYLRQKNFGIAHALFSRSRDLKPDQAETLINIGVCLYDSSHIEEAYEVWKKAYEIRPDDPDLLSNLCSAEVGLGRFKKALYWGKKGLKIEPENKDILFNSGLACLAVGDYKEGWRRYDVSLGNRFRQERFFDPEHSLPRWEGEKVDGDVVVYGEQGLGDEILFASILPDAMKSAHIILECDRRLSGLFARSFPELTVYPTRWDDELKWPGLYNIKAKCDAGHLGRLFRPDVKKIPRGKYLVADPERRAAMRAVLDNIGPFPKVGIAWTGGNSKIEQERRNLTLDKLTPLLGEDVHWVDLEYRDRSLDIHRYVQGSGIPINHFPWATLHPDYDNTAALVAELDLVICVSTTVGELAGALGVPCLQMVPWVPTWRVGSEGKEHPWYESVQVFRQQKQGEWDKVITEVRTCMLSMFADRAATMAPAA